MRTRLFLIACTVSASTAVGAQSAGIYRCGNSYTQTPCADGRRVTNDDARSEADVADAEQLAAHERRQGKRMERQRLLEESRIAPAVASGFDSRSSPAPLLPPSRVRAKKRGAVIIVRPGAVATDGAVAVAPKAMPRARPTRR